MQHIEYWFIRFIQTPQFRWIALLFTGLVLVEIVLHNRDEACRRAAGGVSSCFGLICSYVLTAVLFGPLHHSLLEKLSLSSCLPFLSDHLTTDSDWAVFSLFKFPGTSEDLCYGILKLFLICLLYNLINEAVEKNLKERCEGFWAWIGIQALFIFVFTLLISTFNYIIGRMCCYLSWFEQMIQFFREKAVIICVVISAFLLIVIITKVIISLINSVNAEDLPILGAVSNMFFGNAVGVSLVKAAITAYFLILIFKIVSMTYIKEFVFSNAGQTVLIVVLALVFIWYMIRQKLLKKD